MSTIASSISAAAHCKESLRIWVIRIDLAGAKSACCRRPTLEDDATVPQDQFWRWHVALNATEVGYQHRPTLSSERDSDHDMHPMRIGYVVAGATREPGEPS